MVVSRATRTGRPGRAARGVARATILAAALTGCTKTSPTRESPPPQPTARDVVTTEAAAPAATTPSPTDRAPATLALAYPDSLLAPSETETLLQQLPTAEPREARAIVLALGHRAPLDQLARVAAAVPAARLPELARALAGRTPTLAPHDLPPQLLRATRGTAPVPALTTLVQRFHLRARLPYDPTALLFAPSEDDQVSGARLLANPAYPLPPAEVLTHVAAPAVPALARSLTQRNDTPRETLVTLLTTLAGRAVIAPRQWGNAWRAMRDAVPVTDAALAPTLISTTATADTAPLTDMVGSFWRCENARVADKAQGHLDRTLHCADPAYPWIATVAQAETLPALHLEPADLAAQLTALLAGRHETQVLSAIATASVALPPALARPLLRTLAQQHDPGVLAATLEALNGHPEIAAALPNATRDGLLRAPFDLPEGPALEARIEAIRLARALHAPSALGAMPDSSVRAIQLALQPDAGVLPAVGAAPSAPVAPVYLRITTDVGRIELELLPAEAPRAVAQLVDAARAHRYDGLTFHRVVPGFVVQGGDPRGDGYGGTESPTTTELSLRPFERGSVGIPLAGLDTGGIQMFIVMADAPHLDGRYPWVGRVRRGMDVAEAMLVGDRIQRVEVVEEEGE